MKKICRKKILTKLKNLKGFWFHILGVACLIWFIIRVLPAPHRYQYPCQQISIPIALGYLAFWSTLFHGLTLWLKKAKHRTSKAIPAFLVILIIGFTITGMVFAYNINTPSSEPWYPISKEPIGTPKGVNPGRVVWLWNPDATETGLEGYWWMNKNNNQAVIDQMFSTGIKDLAGLEDDYDAWDAIFKYFNQVNGEGEVGYQKGEKIAIKINLNNCWDYLISPYIARDNDRDASPQVVKALLRHLVNVVGVAQEDIIIYDASRPIPNWFYKRVYYETYPAIPLKPEFPDVNYIDKYGGAMGRQKVQESTVKIYFADGTGFYRTLPKCVVDAKYIINMPLLKRHPSFHGVTLSGKNYFGTFIESVADLHPYHEAGFTMGNPAPMVDFFAHEHVGGKTFLYIADGLFGTLADHCKIDKFQMYPFNNDWTNSLFFSQDPVAIDSVMYDFLHTEDNTLIEGAQNYLHQSAEPQTDLYDPEMDGVFLSESLGVHEHWDPNVDIFSSDRYSGLSNNGIDFVTEGEEYTLPAVVITKPKENGLYMFGEMKRCLPISVIIGMIDVVTMVNGISEDVEKVEFYLNGVLQFSDNEEPYVWLWDKPAFFRQKISVIAYFDNGKILSDDIIVWKLF